MVPRGRKWTWVVLEEPHQGEVGDTSHRETNALCWGSERTGAQASERSLGEGEQGARREEMGMGLTAVCCGAGASRVGKVRRGQEEKGLGTTSASEFAVRAELLTGTLAEARALISHTSSPPGSPWSRKDRELPSTEDSP